MKNNVIHDNEVVYTSTSQLSTALEYCELGIRIFPVHGIVDGKCTCGGRADCKPGKHPAVKRPYDIASTDPSRIRRWWKQFPDANIGIPTGRRFGFFVLDIDPDKGGWESLRWLEEQCGPLPKTWSARTGSGGRHDFFLYPKSQRIACSVGGTDRGIAPGLDMRGEGGHVVGAGSRHECGDWYGWINPPSTTPLAAPPGGFLKIIAEASKRKKRLNADFDETFRKIEEGIRDTTVFEKFACICRDKCMNPNQVEIICLALNSYSCDSPLCEDQVRKCVSQAFKYPVRPSRIRKPSKSAEKALLYLRERSRETGWVECSVDEIRIAIGLKSEKGARNCLRRLEQFGLLHTQEITGDMSRYTPLSPGSSSLKVVNSMTPEQPRKCLQCVCETEVPVRTGSEDNINDE